MPQLMAHVLVILSLAWAAVVQGDSSSTDHTGAEMNSLGSDIKNAVQDMKGQLSHISELTKGNAQEHAAASATPERQPATQHSDAKPELTSYEDAQPEVTSYEETEDDETMIEDGKGKEWQSRQVCTNGDCKTTHETHELTPEQVSSWMPDWMLAPMSLAQVAPKALNILLAATCGLVAGSGLTTVVLRLMHRGPSPQEEPLLEA